MSAQSNIFLKKKILIYGLGKTGLSAFKFLKEKSDIFLFDDFQIKVKNSEIENRLISYKNILRQKIDLIILSPGIDINRCRLSEFLKKNYHKVYSDLDVFYAFFKNDCITVTGTNGKSTTCQLLYEILLNQKFDVKLVGNIGNPILSIKNIKKKTIFVIEASSYQLEYSKNFSSKYGVILNIAPDHIERHKTINKYVKAKFRLLENQSKGNLAFIKKDDPLISKHFKYKKFESKIVKVNTKNNNIFKKIDNTYFLSETNKENLSFIIKISESLKLKKHLLIKTIQKFKGLKYRQQIIFKNKYLTVINDSKSTSFASSVGILKTSKNIHWLLGGLHKKGDKFNLSKKYFKNISAYVYGKNKKFFNESLHKKIKFKNFKNLKSALKKIFIIVRKKRFANQTILFSPSAASFDSFKNFEDRGCYFDKLIKKYLNGF